MGARFRNYLLMITTVFLLSLITGAASLSAQDLPLVTLEECIEKGLKNDPSIVRSEANLTYAKNNIWGSYGSFLPNVSVSWGYGWNSRPQQVDAYDTIINDTVVTIPVYSNENYSSGLSISQNLFNGFSDYFTWRANKQAQKASEMSLNTQVITTVYNLKTSYFNVLKTMKLADVQKKALERSNEQLRITETRYELGSAALSDVLKAKVSNGEAKLNLISAENNYKIAMAQLNQLMGEDITRQYRVDSTVSLREVDYTMQSSIDYAMEHNPELKSYEYSMNSSKNSVKAAWGGLLPTVDFSWRASWYQPKEFDFGGIFRDNRTHSYGISVGFNIFDRFSTKRSISNAKATLNTDKFNYYNFINSLQLQVTESYLNYEKAMLSMEVSNDKLASAQEDYKLAQEKYSLGAATILDLLDAEVSLKTAENDVIESDYNLNLAIVDLEQAMGISNY